MNKKEVLFSYYKWRKLYVGHVGFSFHIILYCVQHKISNIKNNNSYASPIWKYPSVVAYVRVAKKKTQTTGSVEIEVVLTE